VHQGNLAESPLSAMRESIFDYEYFLEFKDKIARLIMVETFAEPMYAKYQKIGLIAMYLQERVK
jgi:hypothetical protein